MDEFVVEKLLPVKAISDNERKQRTWLLRRKLKRKKLKDMEKFKKKKSKHKIDIYV